MHGQEIAKEIELICVNEISQLKSYKVATVDRGYHVYVVVLEAAVGQILPYKARGRQH